MPSNDEDDSSYLPTDQNIEYADYEDGFYDDYDTLGCGDEDNQGDYEEYFDCEDVEDDDNVTVPGSDGESASSAEAASSSLFIPWNTSCTVPTISSTASLTASSNVTSILTLTTSLITSSNTSSATPSATPSATSSATSSTTLSTTYFATSTTQAGVFSDTSLDMSSAGSLTALTTTSSLNPLESSSISSPASSSTTSLVLPEQEEQETKPILCNGYAELCDRKYSNVSMVGAHNSPFVFNGTVAANQELPVTQQLDDGIRFLQGQMHWPEYGKGPHFCHTSCELLDAGPITNWLIEVREWVARHPHDVVTILLGNGNYSPASAYVPAIESTGILDFVYTPPRDPEATKSPRSMHLGDWPTLREMIQNNTRVVIMLDYKADEIQVPWLLDEFSYMWETPFDPTITNDGDGNAPPCVVQRPPGLSTSEAQDRMYLLNYNINMVINVLGKVIHVPALTSANATNAATGRYSLGAGAADCVTEWGRPPLVLNVDYYNHGKPPGSVFQVAANLNNVTYNGTCCGLTATVRERSEGVQKGASTLILACYVLATVFWLW